MARRHVIDQYTTALVRLDESVSGAAVDVGPNSLAITDGGATAQAAAGAPFAYSRAFSAASSQYMAISQSASWETPAMTMSCWIRLASTGQAMSILDSYGPSTQGSGLTVDAAGTLAVFFHTGASSVSVPDSAAMVAGQWYHVAASYDGAEIKLYKDGLLVATTAVAGSATFDGTVPMSIGRRYDGTRYFDGEIADVAMSSTDRRAWEVLGPVAAATDPVAGFTVEAGKSLAVYNFNNPAEGAVVYDDTGGHDGFQGAVAAAVENASISSKKRVFTSTANQYLTIPYHSDFSVTTPKTYELWIRAGVLTNAKRYIFMHTNGAAYSPNIHAKNSDPQNILMSIRDVGGNSVSVLSTSSPLVTGRLVYLALTWDPVTKTLAGYVNGNEFARSSNWAIIPADADHSWDINIGNSSYYSSAFSGGILAVAISNYDKSSKEIYDYYHGSAIAEVG